MLFIGNSYTAVNNLPILVYSVAYGAGDTLVYDAYTPGGRRFIDHASDPTALAKIKSKKWDQVVLQGQSQETSLSDNFVQNYVYPYAKTLCDSIFRNNSCSRPVFYMTWGRKNGDASNCNSWPVVCTYEGMDSMINLRYRRMASINEAHVSPVGAVWRYIRENHPSIELYDPDESHPSIAGSYAAACTFYAILFQKDPTLSTFNYSLPADDAIKIKKAAKLIAYDSLLKWQVGRYLPFAIETHNTNNLTVYFSGKSKFADTHFWDFGDGNTSTNRSPSHTYQTKGVKQIQLIVTKCGHSDTLNTTIEVGITSVDEVDLESHGISIYPNPTSGSITLSGLSKFDRIRIHDLSGRLVREVLDNGSNEIDASDLESGIYLIQVSYANGTRQVTSKLIKN